MRLIKYLLLLIPTISFAGPYYELNTDTTTGTALMRVSGNIGIAASSNTPTNYVIKLDGVNSRVGIGKSNPSYPLDVIGDVNITGLYRINGVAISTGGSGGYTSFVIDDFTSQTNGSQTQFTLSQQPLNNSLQVSKNGLVLKSTADYSLSGQIITMVTAPSSNTALMAMYAIGVSTDEATIIQDGAPIGSFIAYSSTISPQGYLYCDGRWINKNSYPALFSVTGYRYSTFTITSGDWFQLPDLRGMFLRGDDTYNSKSLGYRVIGSTQADSLQGHGHYIRKTGDEVAGYGLTLSGSFGNRVIVDTSGYDKTGSGKMADSSGLYDNGFGIPRISTETRPENTAVAYHIKYANIGTATIKLSSSNVILASSNTWSATNTFNNNTIFNSSISINANATQQYALTIDSNSNTSDGYLLSFSTSSGLDFFRLSISSFGKTMPSPDVESGYVKIGNICIESGRTIQTNIRNNGTKHYFPYAFRNGTIPYVIVSLDSIGGSEGYVIRTRNTVNTYFEEAWDAFNPNASNNGTSIRWIAFGLCD